MISKSSPLRRTSARARSWNPSRRRPSRPAHPRSILKTCARSLSRTSSSPLLKHNAVYEGKYLLGTSFARPVIAKRLVEIARKEGATAICHGCTGKGNDQVRFELTIKALAPDLEIIAPWRIWDIKSRDEEIDYAKARGIDVPVTKKRPYSMDRNLWHLSSRGRTIWKIRGTRRKDDLYLICNTPEQAPDEAEYVDIECEKGDTRSRQRRKAGGPVALIEKLNDARRQARRGHRGHGGEPSGGHEEPRRIRDPRRHHSLCRAHESSKSCALTAIPVHFKDSRCHPLCRASLLSASGIRPCARRLSAFVDSTQETMTGTTRVKLYKGSCTPAGTKSPYSLYIDGLCHLRCGRRLQPEGCRAASSTCFGLPMKIRAMLLKDGEKFE